MALTTNAARATAGHIRHGGVGLGFYLVGTIVEEAGGEVEVHSMPDEGTRFTIRIPTAEAPVMEGRQEADLARS